MAGRAKTGRAVLPLLALTFIACLVYNIFHSYPIGLILFALHS